MLTVRIKRTRRCGEAFLPLEAHNLQANLITWDQGQGRGLEGGVH